MLVCARAPLQSAILGMHAIQQRPMVMPGGKIEARPMMYVALTYDHRLVDGREVRACVCARVRPCVRPCWCACSRALRWLPYTAWLLSSCRP